MNQPQQAGLCPPLKAPVRAQDGPSCEGAIFGAPFLQFDLQQPRHASSRDLLVAQEEPGSQG